MSPNNNTLRFKGAAGFTLPAILVVVAALLILVIGLLGIFNIERRTARSYVELQRADLAARAGLEEVKSLLDTQASNDDFLVVQNIPKPGIEDNASLETAPYLYIARGESVGSNVKYTYYPLFSNLKRAAIPGSALLEAPAPEDLYGKDPGKFETMPWVNPAFGAWVPIKGVRNGKEQTVARYSFWVEDLQGKLNPKIAGNEEADGELHRRTGYPFPAPGINPDATGTDKAVLDGIALYALEEGAPEKQVSNELTKRVIKARESMISPGSTLGALGFNAPVERGANGFVEDPIGKVLEKNTFPVIQPYEEKPLIPFTAAINSSMMGKPKLNLNKLLKGSRTSAIGEFASQIEDALPKFASGRKGGFPEDYLKTLAANALDYADDDQDPTVMPGQYTGIDCQPVISEIVMRTDYDPLQIGSRRVGRFTFTLFAELWNMTNQPDSSKQGPKLIRGKARLSYEVALTLDGVGGITGNPPFDSPTWLDNKAIVPSHNLDKIDGKYYSKEVEVLLGPNQYRFYKFATVTYMIDLGPSTMSDGTKFAFAEKELDARGVVLKWNGQNAFKVPKIVRDRTGVEWTLNKAGSATIYKGKAAIPGGSYGPYGVFVNNMGDPRIAPYILNERVGENSYPTNISPNRRNIRYSTIYSSDGTPAKRLWYGRVMPSEWPDRGHDSPLATFPIPSSGTAFDPTSATFLFPLEARSEEYAPQRISNAGRFYSATELGHVYDPIMWELRYGDFNGKSGTGVADTNELMSPSKPTMPIRRNVLPDVAADAQIRYNTGGGNTLRIGRYEHPKFDGPPDSNDIGLRASYLLDLFHTGKSMSADEDERAGDLVSINGQININTAPRDAIRALAAGMLKQDNQLRKVAKWEQGPTSLYVMRTASINLGTPAVSVPADTIADAIILNRPYAAMGELAGIRTLKNRSQGKPVFGNLDLYTITDINWNDSAAEEVFSRIHDAATFRSRNFRVWVIGQSLTGSEQNPEVISETRKVYTVFADPGKRAPNGEIDKSKSKSRVIHENTF